MKNFIAILGLIITLLIGNNVFADTLDKIIEKCEKKWGNDYSMVEYCIDKQSRAFLKVNEKYYTVYVKPFNMQAVKKFDDIPKEVCIVMEVQQKWTDDKELVNWVMVLHECNKQFEALNKIKKIKSTITK